MIKNISNKIVLIFNHLIFKKPLIYWFKLSDEYSNRQNFGDIITPYLVKKISKITPIHFEPNSGFSKYFKHSIMVGSILSKCREKTIVWGSGIIRENENVRNADFRVVRGPRTYKRLKQLGYNSSKIFGDPALLLPLFYNPQRIVKYEYGIISHYIDFNNIEMELNKHTLNVLHINLLTTNVESVIDQILSCKKIISTSLHGVIVSHAYKIPAKWWEFSNNLSGDGVKFYDYFESVNINNIKPVNERNIKSILYEIKDYYLINENIHKEMQYNLLLIY
jgi:hypothetical protein